MSPRRRRPPEPSAPATALPAGPGPPGPPVPDLREVVARLEGAYGQPEPPLARDPFAAVVWENVAYLVDDERRRLVFERLRDAVGITPEALLAVPEDDLARLIADGGMLPAHRAAKVQKAAAIAAEIGVAELRRQAAAGTGARLLRRFPGIGEPGADRLLLLAGGKRTLGPDSNALRVLVRLGYGAESDDYTAMYRSAAAAAGPQLPDDFAWLVSAHQLLRRHGQEVCKRSVPRCEVCPLTRMCAWYAAGRSGQGEAPAGTSPRRS
jgi:endonuclease III